MRGDDLCTFRTKSAIEKTVRVCNLVNFVQQEMP